MPALAVRSSILFPLAALLFAGCGGADDGGRPERPSGAVTEAIDQCAAAEQRVADGWEFATIVDFERPEGEMRSKWPATCAAAFACDFYFNYDSALSPARGTACSEETGLEIELDQPLGVPYVAPMPQVRCDASETAYHLTAKNVAICVSPKKGRQGWGATLAITFRDWLDASDWDGISFWAKRGEGSSNQAFLAAAKDPFTLGVVGQDDNYCSPAENAPDATKCDPFGLAVLLEAEWRFVSIPFALMRQKGFGVPAPTGQLDTTLLGALELGFSAGDWDVWFDDLSFYREPR